MIYVTGDLHGGIDIHKLSMKEFPQQEEMTKQDYVIVLGDFGLIWNNEREELFWRDWLLQRNFTTLFIDGNHENFDLLNKYPVELWNGGKIQKINDSIFRLMRGQIFRICDKKFFTMGGASSIDKHNRIDGLSWWKEEIPNDEEFHEAIINLDKYNDSVDFILSHTCTNEISEQIVYHHTKDKLTNFFSHYIEPTVNYNHWYFGHLHDDIEIDDRHTLLYDKIIKIV